MSLLDRRLTRRGAGALLGAAMMLTGLAACGDETSADSGKKVTITHAQGSSEIPENPQKIVVLDFGALDTINALGLADRVVGIPKGGTIPDSLKQFKDEKYANVGGLKEPDIEAIHKLKPDLVIAGFRTAKSYPELAKHFPTIDITYDTTKTSLAEGVAESAAIIGKAVGKEDEAKKKAEEVSAAVKEAAEKMPKGSGMILMTSAGKVTLHGPASRFGVIHTELGVKPAGPSVKEAAHGDPISFETIQKSNPDMLFVIDRDAAIGLSLIHI